MKKPIVFPVFAALSLAACGPLIDFGSDTAAPNVYSLTVPVNEAHSATSDDAVLMVDMPDLPGHARGIRIPVAEGQNGVSWYGGAEWSEGAPDMLRRVLRAGLAVHLDGPVVGAGALDVRADCRLATNISQFQFRPTSGQVEVSADFRLIGLRNGRLISSHQAVSRVTVGLDTADNVVSGFDQAASEITTGLSTWLQSHMTTCKDMR